MGIVGLVATLSIEAVPEPSHEACSLKRCHSNLALLLHSPKIAFRIYALSF